MAVFHDIMEELGAALETEIIPEPGNVVELELDDELLIRLELEVSEEFILVASFVSELPPGKFRENILKDCLRANEKLQERRSILSYVEASNQLVLFQMVPIEGLTGDLLAETIFVFSDRLKKWTSAIEAGRTMPTDEQQELEDGGAKSVPLFGFK